MPCGPCLFRAYSYKRRYMSQDRFDNFYVTYNLLEIDNKREEQKKETIMPLMFNECSKYIYTSECFIPRIGVMLTNAHHTAACTSDRSQATMEG